MSIDGFIQNSDLLEEKSNVKDLLDFKSTCDKFSKKLDSINGSGVIALVGPFGSGKSTMLNQLSSNRPSEKWFEFDAWKYPDRQNLWEGFVLDTLASIDKSELEKAKKEILGTQNNDKKTLITTLSKIPGFTALEGLNHFLATTPAKRVCDIQEILNKHLQKIDKDLVIIIEDIDRSGDAGIFFLETLKQFLRTYIFKKRIIIVVPMANDNYEKNIDSYLKSIDYFEFFETPDIKLENFVNEIFDPKLFEDQQNRGNQIIWTGVNRKSQLISFLEGLFKEIPSMNMRLLKLILRKANIVYKNEIEDGFNPDFRVTICIEASKYFKRDSKSDETFFNFFKSKNYVESGTIFSAFLVTMLINEKMIYTVSYSGPKPTLSLMRSQFNFKFIEREGDNVGQFPSTPWQYGMFPDDKGYGITSFYIKY